METITVTKSGFLPEEYNKVWKFLAKEFDIEDVSVPQYMRISSLMLTVSSALFGSFIHSEIDPEDRQVMINEVVGLLRENLELGYEMTKEGLL